MKNKIIVLLIMMIGIAIAPPKIYADVGPKPSISIKFLGFEEEKYYVTLLTENGSKCMGQIYNECIAVEQAFQDYVDVDGYLYAPYYQDCTDTHMFSWTYDPPDQFKVLIYFSEYDKCVICDEIYKTSNLNSSFTVSTKGETIEDIINGEATLQVKEQQHYLLKLIAFLFRLGMTILIEVCLAALFCVSKILQIKMIALVNCVTQVFLNLMIIIGKHMTGSFFSFAKYFLVTEILVLCIEVGCYLVLAQKNKKIIEKKRVSLLQNSVIVIYTIIANIATLLFGFVAIFV